MSIKLKVIESNLGKVNQKPALYAKVQSYVTFTTEDFANRVSTNHGVSLSNAKAVLNALSMEMLDCLCNGHNVKIDGIGTFSLNLTGKVILNKNNRVSAKELHLNGIRLTPDKAALRILDDTNLEIVNKDAEQPVAITLEEAEAVAIRMLKDSPVFYTSDFAFKTRLSKHLSYKYLKQLTQKGVLKREGSKRLYAYTKA